ncbi:CRAL-TRIO domain-containing protein C23B6.04c [Leucoagaricus sp. SymC.cos]|nr:CRAL-TRIO domain-containing protein C23B6.04c [Leucoagaricus sp. SymC.cos]
MTSSDSKSKDKTYTPSAPPDDLYRSDPLPPLTPRERDSYKEVFEHFSKSGYKLPDVPATNGELTEDEKLWLSYECILRFLRGAKWKPLEAIKRLEDTLKWRREFGLYTSLTADCVEKEARSGTQILLGHDTQGRPAFYMKPGKPALDTSNELRHLQLVVYMLERCIDLMPPGVETINLLLTYTSTSTQPSISYARTVLSILQTHYPERLSHASLSNCPVILSILLKFVLAFIDPITRSKFKPEPTSLLKECIFTPEGLMKQTWGGSLDFEYQHEKYWNELIRITDERRESWKAKWRELGSILGTREWKYKQSDVHRDERKVAELAIASISASKARGDGREHRLRSPSGWVVLDE